MTTKTRYELNEMTRADLAEYAEGQGVAIKTTDNKGTVIDRILGVLPNAGNGAMPPEPDKPTRKMQVDAPDIPLNALYTLSGERITGPIWKVRIHETQTERGTVDATVNGYLIRVKRGVWVRVLEPYVEVLRNAVIHTIEMDPETGLESPRSIHNYPFEAQLEAA